MEIFDKKSFPFLDTNLKKEIVYINKNKIFLFGLLVKLFLIIYTSPIIYSELFIPFLKNNINNFSLDPWTNFLESGGNINSFPYGISMLISYLPLTYIGNLIDKNIFDLNFTELFFKLSSLFYDYILLIVLSLIIKNSKKIYLIFSYWLSPIIIYTTYIHGQIDILPITLIISSILFLSKNKFRIAGLIIALAISSKLSMLIALPFILLYVYRKKGINHELFDIIFYTLVGSATIILPYLFSTGYLEMVIKTKVFSKLYLVYIPFGEDLKLYIIPIIYIISLYLIWRLKRITQDLFIISTGIGFFSILIFLPPAPGWSVWVVPFLIYYQITSKKDLLTLGLFYNFFIVANIVLFSSGASYNYNFVNLPLLSNKFYDLEITDTAKNILFTLQQGISFLLAIRMYIYGLKKNNFFCISTKQILINISGDNYEKISKFVLYLSKLFYQKHLNIISASKCMNSVNIDNNYISNKEEIFNYTYLKNNDKKITYYTTFISKGINSINNLIKENKKDFLLFINDMNIKNSSLYEKSNININISKSERDNINIFESKFSSINQSTLSFNFKNINKSNLQALVIYLPIGFLHSELLRIFLSVSSLHVDTELLKDNDCVKMTIEGSPSSEDIAAMSKSIIPEIDDFSIKEDNWAGGYEGIMQIVLFAKISSLMKNSFNNSF